MQVSQRDDHITTAAVGEKKSTSMGIEDSAALMHILSTTLYTHPMYAAVREIICNGWDAHIVSGKTDLPLKIDVTNDRITIRDFGIGLSREDFARVYGNYGASTKKSDSNQTGGFGLGSKAPFAVTDNFEVISHFGGEKTIYHIAKSSMELNGKPSINEVLTVPSDEVGISVSFSLGADHDSDDFIAAVENVVYLGDIKAELNGNLQEIMNWEGNTTGYMVSPGVDAPNISDINLRYGNVVYSIPSDDSYIEELRAVKKLLHIIPGNTMFVFMAPPDSISIAPTREAVILTKQTKETIKSLLSQLSVKLPSREELDAHATQVARTKVKQLVRTASTPDLWKLVKEQITFMALFHERGENLRTDGRIQQATSCILSLLRRYHLSKAIDRFTDLQTGRLAIEQLTIRGAIKQKLGKAMLSRIDSQKNARYVSYPNMDDGQGFYNEIVRHMIAPLRQKLKEHPLTANTEIVVNEYHRSISLVRTKELCRYSGNQQLELLTGRVLVVRSRKNFKEWVEKQVRRELQGTMVIVTGAKKQDRDDLIKKALENYPLPVEYFLPEPKARVRLPVDPNAPVKPKPIKRKGYLPLSKCFNGADYLLSEAREKTKPEDEISDPKAWVVLANKNQNCWRIPPLNRKESVYAYTYHGNDVAVVTPAQAKVLQQKGIPSVNVYIRNYADNVMATHRDFRRYAAFTRVTEKVPREVNRLLNTMILHKDFMDSMGIRFGVCPEVGALIAMFEEAGHNFPRAHEILSQAKTHPVRNELAQKVAESPYRPLISMPVLAEVLENSDNLERIAAAKDLTKLLLKGK